MAIWSEIKFSKTTRDLRIDAEHYRPEYLQQEARASELNRLPLMKVAEVSDGNHLSIAEQFSEQGVRYLRGQDLSDFFVSDVDPLFIPQEQYAKLVRSHMFPGDVLVGIVGTIGSVGIVTDRHGPLTGSCKLAIVRAKALPSEYVAIYLASKIGQNEIAKRIRGAVQMGLILPDMRELPVIEPQQEVVNRIVKLVHSSQERREKERQTIKIAEGVLLEALGLDKLETKEQKWYSPRFHELQAEARFDAEYFNPKHHRIIDKLRKSGQKLKSVATLSERKFIPAAGHNSSTFRYIEIGSLTGDGEAVAETLDINEAPSRATWVVRAGDVITSMVRPIRRLSAIIGPEQDGCVCSSGFAVLTPTGKDPIEPEVLLTFLRLPVICQILDLETTASMYPAIPVERLMELPVPVLNRTIRKEIATKVQDGISLRRDSLELLNEAKRIVEGLVSDQPTVRRRK